MEKFNVVSIENIRLLVESILPVHVIILYFDTEHATDVLIPYCTNRLKYLSESHTHNIIV